MWVPAVSRGIVAIVAGGRWTDDMIEKRGKGKGER